MRRGTLGTVCAPLAVSLVVPATALADDCSYTSPTDCYNQILIALIVIAALALLVTIGWEVILGAGIFDATVVVGEAAAASGEGAALDLAAAAQRLIVQVGTDLLGDSPNSAWEVVGRLAQSEEGRSVLRAGAQIAASLLINPPADLPQELVGPLQSMLEIFQTFGVKP